MNLYALKEKEFHRILNPKINLPSRAISKAIEYFEAKKQEAKRHYNDTIEIHRRLIINIAAI